MASKSVKSVGKKPAQEESGVKIKKEKIVMFFMAFGIM